MTAMFSRLPSLQVSSQDPGGGTALVQGKPVVPVVTNGSRYIWAPDKKCWLLVISICIEFHEYIPYYALTETLIGHL